MSTPCVTRFVVIAEDEDQLAGKECVVLRQPLWPIARLPGAVEVAGRSEAHVCVADIEPGLHNVLAVLLALTDCDHICRHQQRQVVEHASRWHSIRIDAGNPTLSVRPEGAEGFGTSFGLVTALLVEHLAGLVAVVVGRHDGPKLLCQKACVRFGAGDLCYLSFSLCDRAAGNLRLELEDVPTSLAAVAVKPTAAVEEQRAAWRRVFVEAALHAGLVAGADPLPRMMVLEEAPDLVEGENHAAPHFAALSSFSQ